MNSEKVLIELPPYYRTLLDCVRTLIHLIRPDLGPPTQSHCVQFLLSAFPVTQLLAKALEDRERQIQEKVNDIPGEPAIPAIEPPSPESIWYESLRKLEHAKPAANQRKRRRSRNR